MIEACLADFVVATNSKGKKYETFPGGSCSFELRLKTENAYRIDFLSGGVTLAALHFDSGIPGFSVSVLPVGGSPYGIDLGDIVLRGDVAIPMVEPLDQIDSDLDGLFDRQDPDDDNDEVTDHLETDCDLDGVMDDHDPDSSCLEEPNEAEVVAVLGVKPPRFIGESDQEDLVDLRKTVKFRTACSVDRSSVTPETFRVTSDAGEAVPCEFSFFSSVLDDDLVKCSHDDFPFLPGMTYHAAIEGITCVDGREVVVQSWSWQAGHDDSSMGDQEDYLDDAMFQVLTDEKGQPESEASFTQEELKQQILEVMDILEDEERAREAEKKRKQEEERKKKEWEERKKKREEDRKRNNDDSVVSFVTFGDWGTSSQYQMNVAGAIGAFCEKRECEFVLTLGDNFYEAGVASVEDEYWRTRYFRFYGDLALPFYAILGNHDMDGNEKAQIDYSLKDPSWRMPGEYYSIRLPQGSAKPLLEIFAINSDNFNSSVQLWLDTAIKESPAVWKIVALHHPLISNGMHKDNSVRIGSSLLPIICNRIDLLLSGHDHIFSHLRTNMGSCKIDQLIIGTGGASFHLGAKADARTLSTATVHGFGWIEAGQQTLRFNMVQSDTTIFYSTQWDKK